MSYGFLTLWDGEGVNNVRIRLLVVDVDELQRIVAEKVLNERIFWRHGRSACHLCIKQLGRLSTREYGDLWCFLCLHYRLCLLYHLCILHLFCLLRLLSTFSRICLLDLLCLLCFHCSLSHISRLNRIARITRLRRICHSIFIIYTENPL